MELINQYPPDGKEDYLFSDSREHNRGDIFIERDISEAQEEDDSEIESWGVYFQGKDKTLLGLFWDKELAKLFVDAVKDSKALDKVKEIA
jgi:hypothetical protein